VLRNRHFWVGAKRYGNYEVTDEEHWQWLGIFMRKFQEQHYYHNAFFLAAAYPFE